MHYREIYEKEVCEIPSNFDIHHLDENRENNDISNLLMLPHHLHQKYHNIKRYVEGVSLSTNILSINESGDKHNIVAFDHLSRFMEIHNECCNWKDYKEFCLGNIPNIHNINI